MEKRQWVCKYCGAVYVGYHMPSSYQYGGCPKKGGHGHYWEEV
ncbi:MAG: hypothetical protein QXY76_06340 [Nitrososphaeria archaeon]